MTKPGRISHTGLWVDPIAMVTSKRLDHGDIAVGINSFCVAESAIPRHCFFVLLTDEPWRQR
jgi:hypothetical protein